MFETLYSMAEDRNLVKRYKYGEMLIWLPAVLILQYAMSCENDILNKGVLKFMVEWAQIKGRPMQMIDAWNQRIKDDIARNAPNGWVVNFENK